MGVTKKIERRGKRLLVGLASRLVKTAPMSSEEVRTTNPRRILVVRQQNQMGDQLLAIPAYRAIKESLGDVELGVVTAPINRDVLLNNPYVDHVFTYNNRDLAGTIRMIREIRRGRYDLVIVLHTVSFSFTSALIGLLSGARIRVGSTSDPFGNALSGAFYHLELPLPGASELAQMNEAEHNVYPLRAMGIDTKDLSPIIVPGPASQSFAREFLERATRPGRKRIVVHPGAGKAANVWSPSNFAEVVNRLSGRTEIDLLVVRGPRDAHAVDEFGRAVRVPYTLVEGRPISDVAAVLRASDLVLCNDTGIMHVSSAVGATTLAVFGPTDPVRWAPRSTNLSVVRAKDGDLRTLDPGSVLEKALGLLGLVDRAEGDLES
jgi:ADP-heptose:LPS heptosyltransferase